MVVQNVLLDPELLKKTGVFTLVSSELVACIGGGYFIGDWLDRKFHSPLVFTIIFVMAGLGYCVWRFRRLNESEKK